MPEDQIELQRGKGRNPHTVKIRGQEQFHRGGFKAKEQINADLVIKEKSRPIKLIERDFGSKNTLYFQKWIAMKEAGIPVVPTMRLTDRGTIAMTDLRADGSELYGKGLVYHALSEGKLDKVRESHPLDKNFSQIIGSEEKLEQLRTKAQEYADIASNSNILLAADDPFELIIHPDGAWDLVCLDLEEVKLNNGYTNFENDERVNIFMNMINQVPGILKSGSLEK